MIFSLYFFRCKNRQKKHFTKIYSTSSLIYSMKSKFKYRMAQIIPIWEITIDVCCCHEVEGIIIQYIVSDGENMMRTTSES